MLSDVLAWLVVGLLVVVALHEATHVAIARLHRQPIICVAVNPIGIAILFEDAPRVGYRLAQVVVPALVTWAAGYLWLANCSRPWPPTRRWSRSTTSWSACRGPRRCSRC